MLSHTIVLRDVTQTDIPIFFEQQLDPDANYMAGFTSRDPADREAFTAHWRRILGDTSIIKQTILADGQVAGYIVRFEMSGEPNVGYWIGKPYWGKGVATAALSEFLKVVSERPLYAHAAKDNAGSIRVLEKCGFTHIGVDRGYANARGMEIEEVVMRLG